MLVVHVKKADTCRYRDVAFVSAPSLEVTNRREYGVCSLVMATRRRRTQVVHNVYKELGTIIVPVDRHNMSLRTRHTMLGTGHLHARGGCPS